jgi:serine/threonine protein kinase
VNRRLYVSQANSHFKLSHCQACVCVCVYIEYRMLSKKGEGTFSEVLKAQCIKTSKFVAIKCMKGSVKSIEQV